MKILGIDPGFARLGWGIIENDNGKYFLISSGCFETEKSLGSGERLLSIYNLTCDKIKESQPEAIALETLFYNTNAKTVIPVGEVRGIILLAAEQMNVPIYQYTPLQVKMAVSGYGRADKNQVQQMTKSILKLQSIIKPDDAADAVAIALTHVFSVKLSRQTNL